MKNIDFQNDELKLLTYGVDDVPQSNDLGSLLSYNVSKYNKTFGSSDRVTLNQDVFSDLYFRDSETESDFYKPKNTFS
jgi:hypothetical protein